jgi:hypothetical protein
MEQAIGQAGLFASACIAERLWVKGFHFAHVAQAGDSTLFLDIFILAQMVPQ